MSWLSRDAVLMTLRMTVTLRPDISLPTDGVMVSAPVRLDDALMDQVTGPPAARSVSAPLTPGPSVNVPGVTVRVPCAGGGLAVGVAVAVAVAVLVAVLVVDGVGEPGAVLRLDDGAVADDDAPPVGATEAAVGDGAGATGEGAT